MKSPYPEKGQELNQKAIKLYPVRTIMFASVIIAGGPLAVGYLMARNFKAMGSKSAARKSLFAGVVSNMLLLIGLILMPEAIFGKPFLLFLAAYILLVQITVRYYQGKKIEVYLSTGAQKASGWRAAGITILSLAISLILILVVLTGFLYIDSQGN